MSTRSARGRTRTVRTLTALAAVCLFAGITSQAASAETTHKFLRNLSLPTTGIQPLGVDPSGNVIVYSVNEQTIQKFSPNGAPVDFTALGSNTIDGKGGFNCPSVPSDCDRIPFTTEGLGPTSYWYGGGERIIPADMNQSTEGASAGYIYIEVTVETSPEHWEGHLVAFDSSGTYKGEIDESQALPDNSGMEVGHIVNVSPGGTIYIYHDNGGFQRDINKYQPVDSDPAHDIFVGQLRRDTNGPGLNEGGLGLGVVADEEYVYIGKSWGATPLWEKYDGSGFTLAQGNALPINLSAENCVCNEAGPWGVGGLDEENSNYPFESITVDPGTHHVFLFDAYAGYIAEWTADNHKVGQLFGGPEILNPLSDTTGYQRPLAVDSSGGSTNGRIYIQSSAHQLAVFGPAVPIPNVLSLQATPTHSGAHVTATIDLNHGPKATSCRVQWTEEHSPTEPVFYSQSTPCSPVAPYPDESTPISGDVTGLTTEQNYRVRVVVKTLNGTTKSQAVVVRPPAVMNVDTEPASEVTRTTALLNGSLNADGMPTEYYFQYGIDKNYRNKTAIAPAAAGSTPTAVAPVEISNLQAGRPYHFRLVATNSLGTTYGADQVFSAASAPIISGVRPTHVGEISATLNANINPGGVDTTYRFEYGTTPEYGSTAPAPQTDIGSGSEPVPVDAELTSLQPGVTYHFRVVATNKWGTAESEDSTFDFFPQSCPNEYVRQLTRSAYLPDCRAYELVSPGNAGGVQLLPGSVTADSRIFQRFLAHLQVPPENPGTAMSPPRFSYLGALGTVNGTNPPNALVDLYTATRTVHGWETKYWGLKGNEASFVSGPQCNLDMSVCIDYRIRDLFGVDPSDLGSLAPYVWSADGKSLGRWPTNFNVVKHAEEYIGADQPSADFSHYVFSSQNIAFAEGGLTKAPGSVYDNDIKEATVTIASKLTGGGDIPQDTGTNTESIQVPALSTDGTHILMSTEAGSRTHLYMRVNDAVTYEIAAGYKTHFLGMTSDGSKVIFSSWENVTPEDTDPYFSNDIYEWDEATDTIKLLSQGNGEGNGESCEQAEGYLCSANPISPERPGLDDMVASQAGDSYFFSPEQLDPNDPGVFNEKNLYVYRNGAAKYVATFDPGTTVNRMQISPDGKHAAFVTAARLTSYNNQGWREMYTFNPETGLLRCASCNPSGAPPLVREPLSAYGEATEQARFPSGDVMASESGRFMSNDGRVAFTTSDPLVESDTNGITDVYEFVDGRPQLISSGTAQRDKFPGVILLFPAEYTGLEAISNDGVDIYFSTFDTLAPGDVNGNFIKFYDARTGGGFAVNAAQLPCVAADECHGEENPQPPPAEIGSSAQLGSTGITTTTTAPPKQHKKKQQKKKHHKKRGKARRHKAHSAGNGGQSNG